MGEVILSVESEVKVLNEKYILIEALKLMTQEDERGRGYSSRGANHYSWLNRAEPCEWETGFDALRGWRFPVKKEQVGVWTEFEFTSEKVGQEKLLFKRIIPYMEGYVKMKTDYDRTIEFHFD